jgi:ornithine decarboxylase
VKYGALASEVYPLIAHAVSIGVVVCGVSFHVGSGAGDAGAYTIAISAARSVYEIACNADPLTSSRTWVVDIGGGFAGGFDKDGNAYVGVGDGGSIPVAATVNKALDDYFPENEFPAGLHIISEPGRYLATFSACLVTRIIGKRVRDVAHLKRRAVKEHSNSSDSLSSMSSADGGNSSEEEEPSEEEPRTQVFDASAPKTMSHYYIGDGTYGAFNAIMYDGWLPAAIPFKVVNEQDNVSCVVKTMATPGSSIHDRASFFGPTCDSLDIVFNDIITPCLEVGDWLLFPHCGAYTSAGACDFNGIPATEDGGVRSFYVNSVDFAETPLDKKMPLMTSSKAPVKVVKNF